MRVRFWNLECVSLAVATVFLVGCEAQPQAGPLPLRVAQTSSTPTAQPMPVSSTTAQGSPAPSESLAASSGFSLPVGADIPPAAASGTAPSSAGPTTLNVPPLAQQPQLQGQQQQSQPSQLGNAPAGPPPVTPSASQGTLIHLSAGVAVPQSLPIGTVMAISVDYAVRGRLNHSSRYIWVIQSGSGEAINEVTLENSGNLSAFFEKLKPEHRPFSAHIEEVTPGSNRRTVVSNEVPLKTDY